MRNGFTKWLLALLVCCVINQSQAQVFEWMEDINGGGNQRIFESVTDNQGNTIVVGAFAQTANFGLNTSGQAVTKSTNRAQNGFVAKYNSTGRVLWVVHLSGYIPIGGALAFGNNAATSVAVDANGDVFVVGSFDGGIDFDVVTPTNLNSLATSDGTGNSSKDFFIVKYRGTDGAWMGQITRGDDGADEAFGVAVNNSGDVLVTGYFNRRPDFRPVGGNADLDANGEDWNIFLAKYSSALAYQAAVSIGGNSGLEYGLDIAVDNQNNVIVTGVTRSTPVRIEAATNSNPNLIHTITPPNTSASSFIVKFNPNLSAVQWSSILESGGDDVGTSVAVDANNNIYLGGYFNGVIDPDNGGPAASITPLGNFDGFLFKYDQTGQSQAAIPFRSSGLDKVENIVVRANDILVTGAFEGNVALGSIGGGGANFTSRGAQDIFVAKYDFNLSLDLSLQIGGILLEEVTGLSCSGDNIFVAGYSPGLIQFSPSVLLGSVDGSEGFLAKYNICVQPTDPTTAGLAVCQGQSATLTVNSGSLGSALNWQWYRGSCQGAAVQVATGPSLTVTPSATESYFVRAEGGCVQPSQCATATITVNTIPSATLSTTAPNCFGGQDGRVDLNPTGGAFPYRIVWSTGATTQQVIGTAGAYAVTVVDAAGCSITQSSVVTEPSQLTEVIAKNDITCFGLNNGRINLTAAGATPPYQYRWNSGQTNAALDSLRQGTYRVTVTDLKGCFVMDSVVIIEPSLLSTGIRNSTNPSNCTVSDGGISVWSSGGTPPYDMQISGGYAFVVDSVSNLAAGIYNITVSDDRSCVVNTAITLTAPSAMTVTTAALPVSCFGAAQGTVYVDTIAGGQAPFSYTWSANAATTDMLVDLPVGNYSVTITDALGCTGFSSVTISQPTAITATLQSTPANCDTCANGTGIVVLEGGTPPYSFIWSDGGGGPFRSNLLAGTYSVTVSDAGSCVDTFTIVVPLVVGIQTQDPALDYIKVFPIPTQNLLQIQQLPPNTELVLINPLGQIVWRKENQVGDFSIDMSLLPPSVYWLQAQTPKGLWRKAVQKIE